jgi:tripartite-type tricarboxylate transporter receptor subunit TctC
VVIEDIGKLRRIHNKGTLTMIRHAVAASISLALSAAAVISAAAQTWPERTIRIVAPFPAGSATDINARLVGEKIGVALGQSVVIDNRVGGGGIVGSQFVARADPDGYTLLIGSVSTHGLNPAFMKKLPYNAITDFVPVAEVATTPNIIVGSPALGIKSIQEFVALAKAKPGQFNYAYNGTGPQVCGELLKMMAGIDVVAVPYKGAPEAFTGVMRNDVAFSAQSITSAIPLIQSGQLTALAVTSKERSPLLPDVPSVAESGYPDYDFTSWTGILAPAGTPKPIIDRLNKEIRVALEDPNLRKRIEELGGTVSAGSPEKFEQFLQREIAKWTKLSEVTGMKMD